MFEESNKFVEMLQRTREFIKVGLSNDENPPQDVFAFLEVVDKLEVAAGNVSNVSEWVEFFMKYTDEIRVVLEFMQKSVEYPEQGENYRVTTGGDVFSPPLDEDS